MPTSTSKTAITGAEQVLIDKIVDQTMDAEAMRANVQIAVDELRALAARAALVASTTHELAPDALAALARLDRAAVESITAQILDEIKAVQK